MQIGIRIMRSLQNFFLIPSKKGLLLKPLPQLKQIMDIQGEYKDIFGNAFSHEVMKTVQNLYTFREEYRKL